MQCFYRKLKCTSQLTDTVVTFANHKNKKILNKTGRQHDSERHLPPKDSPTYDVLKIFAAFPLLFINFHM